MYIRKYHRRIYRNVSCIANGEKEKEKKEKKRNFNTTVERIDSYAPLEIIKGFFVGNITSMIVWLHVCTDFVSFIEKTIKCGILLGKMFFF